MNMIHNSRSKARVMLACGFLFVLPNQVLAQALGASGATRTTVSSAGNGVPVVNIAAPSASGLSHNTFTAYNVGSNGIILNNGNSSESHRLSQLGGYVAANANLGSGAQASVILNEVTSNNRSTLAGYTEVLGGTASVIIANPFGITCAGCGFINTSRASLVTGAADISGGVLNGFNVRGGDILIAGSGLNASAQQMLDLVSRKITVDGQVNANTLNLVAGSNHWNHTTGATTAIASDGTPAPSWAIDSTALGGMYAGRIALKSTEEGTGVRMLGNAAATADDFSINSAGKIEVRSQISAVRDLSLSTSAPLTYTASIDPDSGEVIDANLTSDYLHAIVLTDAGLTAGRNLTLTAEQGFATLRGGSLVAGGALGFNLLGLDDAASSTAGISDANKRYGATVVINASNHVEFPELGASLASLGSVGYVSIDGVNYAAESSLNASAFGYVSIGSSSATTLRSGGTLDLSGRGMAVANASLQSVGDMRLANTGAATSLSVDSSGKLKSTGGNIELTSSGSLLNQGEISADSGNLALASNYMWGSLASSGTLNAGGALQVEGAAAVSLSGTALGRTVSVNSASDLNIDGNLEAGGNLAIDAGGNVNVSSSGRILAGTADASGRGDIVAADTLYNYGVVHSYGDLGIHAGIYNYATGGISALGTLTLTGNNSSPSSADSIWLRGWPGNSFYGGRGVVISDYGQMHGATIESGADISINVGRFTGAASAAGNIAIVTTSDPGSGLSSFYSGNIIAGANKSLSIQWVGTGTNVGLLSAGTINLTGGNSFSNTGTIRAATLNAGGFSLTNSGSPSSAVTTSPTVTSTTYPGLVITLPSNPNGRYVTVANPNSSYLVESNPLYTNPDNYLGSDYLADKYGFKADEVSKRLGDAAYETYLVQQQLIAQLGAATLKGVSTDKALMQGLMDNAGSQAASLGLVYGKALSAAQQGNLKEDMVWMVETTVNGQKVLAPVVYLAASTRAQYQTGNGVIAADTVNMNLSSLTNKNGATIVGQTLNITSQGDITNSGASIKGGEVSLTSTGGSIVNETTVKSDSDNRLSVDKQGSISATGGLNIDAAKDVVNKGATISAAGDVSIAAGRDVVFDTVQTTSGSSSSSSGKSLFNSTTSEDSTYKTEQVKSTLSSGGNLSIKAKNDITLAGTDASAKGSADLDAGGNVNVVARENKEYNYSTTHKEGIGVSGGLWGSETTNVVTEKTRNVGSTITAGKDLSIAAGKTAKIQGSDVSAKGDIAIAAEDVQVLAGNNATKTTTTKQSISVLSISGLGKVDASATAKANAAADAEASVQNLGTASASASAAGNASTSETTNSQAKSDASAGVTSRTGVSASVAASDSATATANVDVGGVDLLKEKSSTKVDETTKAVGSTLSGKNITITAKKTATLVGAKLKAEQDLNLEASDVNILAAEDTHTISETTSERKQGVYLNTDNKATAASNVKAGGSLGTGGVAGEVGGEGSAAVSTSNSIDLLRSERTWSDSKDTSNVASTLGAGGNINIKSGNKLTVQGSDVNAGGNVDLQAKDMEFLAGKDTHTSSKSTTNTSIGLFVDASAKAGGSAGANANADVGAGAGANAGVNASAEYSTGVQAKNVLTQSTESSSKARVSSITSGSGSISRTASESITDVGTAIDAAGDFNQSAKTFTSKAAADTASSSSSTISNSAKIGMYSGASAKAEASADASAGLGATASAEADAKAKLVGGAKVSYSGSLSKSEESSSQAVVSTIKSGGNAKIVSSGKTSLEGTQIGAGKDVEIDAGSLDYSAARDTTSKRSTSGSVDASGSLGVGLSATTAVALDLNLSGEVKGSGSGESTSKAVVGGIGSGGNITIKTKGDARLEGTEIASMGDTSIDAGGKLSFDAARDTSRSDSTEFGASATVTTSAGKNALGAGASAAGSYSQASKEQSEAKVGSVTTGGNLKISAGKSANFEGTVLDAGGDATIAGKEGVTMTAARNTSSSQSFDVSASAGVGVSEKKNDTTTTRTAKLEGAAGVNSSTAKSSEAVVGSVKSGGKLKISSDKDITLEGTELEAGDKASIVAGGSVNLKAAEDTSESTGFGASLSGKAEAKTTKSTGGSGKSGGDTGGSGTGTSGKTGNSGTGGTQGSDGSKKSDADLKTWQNSQAAVLKELKSKQAGTTGSSKNASTDAKTGSAATGATTKKETSPSGTAALNVKNTKTSKKKGGSIKAGAGGVEIQAKGGDVTLEGTKLTTGGNATISASKDVNVKAAQSTESSLGINLKAGGSGTSTSEQKTGGTGAAGTTKKKEGGATATVGINIGKAETGREASEIKTGGKLNISSGGKTTVNDSKIKADGGEKIEAAGGSDRKAP